MSFVSVQFSSVQWVLPCRCRWSSERSRSNMRSSSSNSDEPRLFSTSWGENRQTSIKTPINSPNHPSIHQTRNHSPNQQSKQPTNQSRTNLNQIYIYITFNLFWQSIRLKPFSSAVLYSVTLPSCGHKRNNCHALGVKVEGIRRIR